MVIYVTFSKYYEFDSKYQDNGKDYVLWSFLFSSAKYYKYKALSQTEIVWIISNI